MLIALGNSSLIKYLSGGGHWSWFLQYPLGLKALGHRIVWLELLQAGPDRNRDLALIRQFFARLQEYELDEETAVLRLPDLETQDLGRAEIFGRSSAQISELCRSADLLWNFSCALRTPFLAAFPRKVLIDVDPGHLQVSAFSYNFDLGIKDHDTHLTVGVKINDPDCDIPTLGLVWKGFLPFVYRPWWTTSPDPGAAAPFTSITQWEWEELEYRGRMLSISKRAAYRKYAQLPRMTQRPFDLAANIGPNDVAHDRAFLIGNGWTVSDPNVVASSPADYRHYIRQSRGEIQCPKPIFRDLRTGWLSDRSVGYLASGRPVLAEETGFSERVPTGSGLVAFNSIEEAAARIREIDNNYYFHSRAARELASEVFDSARCLTAMIDAC